MKIIIDSNILNVVDIFEKYRNPLPFEIQYNLLIDDIDRMSADELTILDSIPLNLINTSDSVAIDSINDFLRIKLESLNSSEITSVDSIRKLVYSNYLNCSLNELINMLTNYDVYIKILEDSSILINRENTRLFSIFKNEIITNLYKLGEKEVPTSRIRQEVLQIHPKLGLENKKLKRNCENCVLDYQYHLKFNSDKKARIYFDFVNLFSSTDCNNDNCILKKVCRSETKVILVHGFSHL